MAPLTDLFEWLSDVLKSTGVDVSPRTLQGLALAVVAVVAAVVLVRAVRVAMAVVRQVVEFTRRQIRGRFWRDAGKLATFISFLLLVLGYGLFWPQQSRPLSDALLAMGRDHLDEIVPTAVLTQALLLCAYWMILGRVMAVGWRTLAEPFRLFLIFAAVFAWLVFASVVPFVLAGGDAETLGLAIGVLVTVLGLAAGWLATHSARRDKAGKPIGPARGMVVAAFAILALTGLVALVVAGVYSAVAATPSVPGLLSTDLAILTVLLLYVCYKFRAYIGGAEVPAAIGHFIDFSLAVSAGAIAITGAVGAPVSLGGVPPVVVAAAPALVVAVMVFVIHLRGARAETRGWTVALIVAVAAGILVGPAKQMLAEPVGEFATLLPITWN